MSRHRKLRKDGTRAPRSRRTPKPTPTPEELAELDRLTDTFPDDLRAFRDRDVLNPIRRFRIEEALKNRTRTLTIVLYGVHDPHNQAAVLRSCEALGVQEVHLVQADTPGFRPSPKVTQNADRWLDVVDHEKFSTVEIELRDRGFALWAAEFSPTAQPLDKLEVTKPSAFLFGNESQGLPEEVIAACDGSFVIPLYGFSQSLNISVAAAITLRWAIESCRRDSGQLGDLSIEDQMILRRRFYKQAAGQKIPPYPKA